MWDIKIHTKCIFPFSYSDVLYDELQEKNDSWIIDEASTTESDIYNYVRDSFLTSNDSELADHSIKIGCAYRYAGGHLPDDFRLKYIHKDNNQEFYIREVHLVLFQTGIGILWFSPEVEGCFSSEEDAIDFYYFLKEMARNLKHNYVFIDSDKDGAKPFFLGTWVDKIVRSISTNITYYPSRTKVIDGKKRLIPDKCLFFHCALLNDNDSVERTIVYLTRGYKNSYRLPYGISSQLYSPFSNVRYYASSEGCGYYALADDDTPAFFSNLKKVNKDYFFLYLLALYQSYTLLHYSELISNKLSATRGDYKKYSSKLENSLDDITTELNVFLAKSVYSSVSHVQHQNEYYNYISEKLKIKENIVSVSAGIEALNNIERNLFEEEEKKKSQLLEGGLTMVSLLALLSAFNDVNELLNNHIYALFPAGRPVITVILNGFLGLVTVWLFKRLFTYWKYSSVRKSKKNQKKRS